MSSILLDIHVAYHALDRILQRTLGDAGVSMSEGLVLRLVVLNPRVTIAALRRSTGLAPSTMSGLVGRLVERGFVRRRRLASDRRSRIVTPTSVGRGVGVLVDGALKDLSKRIADRPFASAWPDVSELASALTDIDEPRGWSRLD